MEWEMEKPDCASLLYSVYEILCVFSSFSYIK